MRSVYRNLNDYPDMLGKLTLGSEGEFEASHLPLYLLEKHFSLQFKEFLNVESFAICRNPYERFISAISQHVTQHYNIHIESLSKDDVEAIIWEVKEHLRSELFPKYKYVHFTRQVDYIKLNGEKLVDHIYRIQDISRLLSDLHQKTGQKIDVLEKGNRSLAFKFTWLRAPILSARDFSRRILPPEAYRIAKNLVSSIVLEKTPSTIDYVARSKNTEEFINDYYSEDFEIFLNNK